MYLFFKSVLQQEMKLWSHSCCQYKLGLMSPEAFYGVTKQLSFRKEIKWLFFGLPAE